MNRNISYIKFFGWGIGMYSILFLVWSGFSEYGFVNGFLPTSLVMVLLFFLSYVAGLSLHTSKWQNILQYSAGWVLIMIVLDIIMSVPSSGWWIYLEPNIWIGYSFVLFVPLLSIIKNCLLCELIGFNCGICNKTFPMRKGSH